MPKKLLRTRSGRPVKRLVRALKLYINDTPELLSLLYDMDLLPEQVKEGTHDWGRMLMLAEAWKHRKQWPNAEVSDGRQPPVTPKLKTSAETAASRSVQRPSSEL